MQPESLSCPYPAPPPPFPVHLVVSPEHVCSYLPDRMAMTRAFYADQIPGRVYHELMDASFRRSGKVVYQPVCRGCRECVPLRIPVERFVPNKSQRRCLGRNQDLKIGIDVPAASDEKFEMYTRYQLSRHGEKSNPTSRESFESFLYDSPVETIEFTYRDGGGRLLAVGICDICSASLSSVYFYFEPEESARGLGIFGVLKEIETARQHAIPYYYMGYWVKGSAKMRYKSGFGPHELLQPDGVWVDCAKVNFLTRQDTNPDVKVSG